MNRRDFLAGAAGISSLFFLKSCNIEDDFFPPTIHSKTKFLVGGGHEETKHYDGLYFRSTTENATLFIGGMNDEMTYIPAPGKLHEITPHPDNNGIFFAATKWGAEACLIDANKKTLIKDIRSGSDCSFYGHSLYSSDGQFLFVSMSNEHARRGYISVRDSKTLNEIRTFPTYGQLPHQLQWIEEDKILAVINNLSLDSVDNKFRSVLNFIDVKNGTLIKSFKTSIPKHAHFAIADDQATALAFRSGAIGETTLFEKINLLNGELTPSYEIPPVDVANMESLNRIVFEDDQLAIMTINYSNQLIFWSYGGNRVTHIEIFKDNPVCINITNDRKHVLIKFITRHKKYRIDFYHTDDFLKKKFNAYKSIDGGGSGSHLTIMS